VVIAWLKEVPGLTADIGDMKPSRAGQTAIFPTGSAFYQQSTPRKRMREGSTDHLPTLWPRNSLGLDIRLGRFVRKDVSRRKPPACYPIRFEHRRGMRCLGDPGSGQCQAGSKEVGRHPLDELGSRTTSCRWRVLLLGRDVWMSYNFSTAVALYVRSPAATI
jgi:hypothetical protein